MTHFDLIPHYFLPVNPFVLCVGLALLVFALVGWLVCVFMDRNRK